MAIQLDGLDVLDLAIQTEERGEAFYRQAVRLAETDEAKELFTYLADQETVHRTTFEALAKDVTLVETSSADWQEIAEYIAATVDRAFFSDQGAIGSVPQAASVQEMIRAAMTFEKETLLFFYQLRDLVRPAHREAIDQIVDEEKTHVRRLAAMLTG